MENKKRTNLIKFLFARYICVIALERDLRLYSWCWLILPNWRYYLRTKYPKSHKRFGRYSDVYWKPDRVELWIINGFQHKLPRVLRGLFTIR